MARRTPAQTVPMPLDPIQFLGARVSWTRELEVNVKMGECFYGKRFASEALAVTDAALLDAVVEFMAEGWVAARKAMLRSQLEQLDVVAEVRRVQASKEWTDICSKVSRERRSSARAGLRSAVKFSIETGATLEQCLDLVRQEFVRSTHEE